MFQQRGKHEGFYVVDKDTAVHGMIVGDCRVAHGSVLSLHGTVTGDLLIEDGAEAAVHGTVSGSVLNQGRVTVHGVVGGLRNLTSAASSEVARNAVVR